MVFYFQYLFRFNYISTMNTINVLVLLLAVFLAAEAVNIFIYLVTRQSPASSFASQFVMFLEFGENIWFCTGFPGVLCLPNYATVITMSGIQREGHHGRRHRVRDREAENSELPSINEVKHFKIPDVFTQAKSTRLADDEPEDNNEQVVHHHGRRHHGAHRH